MDNNHKLTKSRTINLDQDTVAIAQCLKDYLTVHGRTAQHYQILRFLADVTLQRLSEGKQPWFNYLAIREAVTGETEGDASAWFGRHWKTLTGDFRQKCEEGIQKFASDQGLTVYPWIEKRESNGGAGNQALICLVALPITRSSSQAAKKLPNHDIDYIPAEKLKLSWWARWLFDKNQVAEGWRQGARDAQVREVVCKPLTQFFKRGFGAAVKVDGLTDAFGNGQVTPHQVRAVDALLFGKACTAQSPGNG